MRDKHNFSNSYLERKEAVLNALRREEAMEENDNIHFISRIPFKILASIAILYVLTVSIYAAVQWVEVRIERNGNAVHFHAGLNESAEASTERSEKPIRSWNSREDEISIHLNIPDLPSDMNERENTNGKYYSQDSSRAMTINGIDLRRSDLDEIIGGAVDAKHVDAGGKAMYVITGNSEAAYYNRTAFIVFEEEELVLKLWVSYGITDEELLTMASTVTLEETDDALLAIPIINEVSDDSYDWTTPIIIVRDSVDEADLLEIGESARADNDWYTVTVNSVDIYDNINVLNQNCILRKDFVERFTDASGKLIPYSRTEIIYTHDGKYVSMQFGESVPITKKLYVVTLTMEDVTIAEDEAVNDEMLTACVNGFNLNSYTVADGEIEIISPTGAVVDRKPEVRAQSEEIIYREYLENNQWKVAYLMDEDIAQGNLVLHAYTDQITVKIQ